MTREKEMTGIVGESTLASKGVVHAVDRAACHFSRLHRGVALLFFVYGLSCALHFYFVGGRNPLPNASSDASLNLFSFAVGSRLRRVGDVARRAQRVGERDDVHGLFVVPFAHVHPVHAVREERA